MTSKADYTSASRDRGVCDHCDRDYEIKVDGTLRYHRLPRTDWYGTPACPGAGKPPRGES